MHGAGIHPKKAVLVPASHMGLLEAGTWYPAGLKEHDFSGLYGYKVSAPLVLLIVCM